MRTSLHQRLKDILIGRFQDLPLGARIPSTRDLAAEFKAAYLTLNRVLRDLEHDGYIIRKAKQGTFLASRERPVSRGFDHAPGATGTVVFIHPDYFSFHYWMHLRNAEEAAVKSGLRLAEFKIQSGHTYERAVSFAKSLPDLVGVITLPVPGSMSAKSLDLLNGLGVPVALVSDQLPDNKRRNLYSVDADHTAMGRLAVNTLVDLGHQHLAYLANEPARSHSMRDGMLAALKKRGLPPRSLKIYQRGTKAWDDSREAAYALSQTLLADGGSTGAILDSLHGAMGLQRALWEQGLSAPTELSFLSIGNSNDTEAYLTPPVTTIDWDRTEETRLAFAAIAGKWPGKARHIALPSTLFPRTSTGPCPR